MQDNGHQSPGEFQKVLVIGKGDKVRGLARATEGRSAPAGQEVGVAGWTNAWGSFRAQMKTVLTCRLQASGLTFTDLSSFSN